MTDAIVLSGKTLTPFASLRRRIEEQGLFRRQFGYYRIKTSEVVLMTALGILPLVLTDSLWIHALDAVFMGFVFGQIGLLFHDAGHRQIFASSRLNDIVGYLCGLTMGASLMSWMTVHNEHHAHPNHEEADPDIALPFFVYSEGQAREARTGRNAFLRFIIHHQAYLYFPLTVLTAISMRVTSWRYLYQNRRRLHRLWPDVLSCAMHIVVYFVVLFLLLSPLNAVIFILLHQLIWGFYMGSVFAPNHKGMKIVGPDEKIDFVEEQVLTSRNVRGNPVTDFVYGGLNYQVEHHLFPNMPRKNLRRANAIVKEFCRERGIAYHETGFLRSYLEVFRHMRTVSRAMSE